MLHNVVKYWKIAILGCGFLFGLGSLWAAVPSSQLPAARFQDVRSLDFPATFPHFSQLFLVEQYETENETDADTDFSNKLDFHFNNIPPLLFSFSARPLTLDLLFITATVHSVEHAFWPFIGRLFVLFHCLKVHLA